MQADLGFALPQGATDCHVHIFEPARFPYAASRRYTPPAATVDDLLNAHERLGIGRVVLVQPSVYGTDNRCLLSALDRLGPRRARGVAVIADNEDAFSLRAMHERGVRGVRLNLQVSGEMDLRSIRARILRLSQQLDTLPWLIQIYASLQVTAAVGDLLSTLPQNVLIDHFGMAQASAGVEQPGFDELLRLASRSNIHLKLSGPYQISLHGPAYEDVGPIARRLFAMAPDRTVWGSDWPHPGGSRRSAQAKPTDTEPFREEDDARNLALIGDWLPDDGSRRRLLEQNAERLFEFGSSWNTARSASAP